MFVKTMKNQFATLIADILQDMGIPDARVEVEVPDDPAHGDYTTNVAIKIATSAKRKVQSAKWKTPMEVALQVADKLKAQSAKRKAERQDHTIGKKHQTSSVSLASLDTLSAIDRVEVAPPGFINVFLTEASLITNLQRLLKSAESATTVKDFIGNWKLEIGHSRRSRVMVEFAHPNTHKAFHIGHLRNITTGESIVRLLESQGNEVIRANYQGDVGMHIAKALFGLLQNANLKAQIAKLKTHTEKVEFLGKAYAAGSKAFEEDPVAKEEIGEINKKIYAKDPSVEPLYQETRRWSLDYFEAIYKRVGSRFDRYYFESEVYESGKRVVLEGLKKGIFEKSDGAIIFPGKKYGLHNRVFVTSEGNATYEAKDMGLVRLQFDEYQPDRIVHVVSSEQTEYFKVIFEAMGQLFPETLGRQYHLIYGWVKLKTGKMSSRSGNVVLGEWLLDEAKKAIYAILERNTSKNKSLDPSQQELIAEKAAVAAVKYAFLKVGTTSEIAFDMETSVSFDGDSGPYLQYTYARARSVLRKAQNSKLKTQNYWSLNPEERAVLRLLSFFPDVVAEAAGSLSPSVLCTYLFRLAQSYNLFYAKHSILGDGKRQTANGKREAKSLQFTVNSLPFSFRLALTAGTAQVLTTGLSLLGIAPLEHM